MKKSFVVLVVCSLFAIAAKAQIVFNEPAGLQRVMKMYRASNMLETEMDGWRIQVLATTDRRHMETARSQFERMYPDIKIEWEHQNPYYKLKAGAFTDRRETLAKCHEIKKSFSQAIPIRERISYEDIIGK